jgi:drug/metabolite transporter (DMT)-like permease
MNIEHLAIILIGAGLILLANQTIMLAMREGDIAFISPFRYTNLVAALILGYLFFGEIPDVWMIIGALIVVLTGIYTFHRERMSLKNSLSKD